MSEKKFTPQIDDAIAVKIGTTIVAMFDGASVGESSTILNGVTMALVTLCKGIRTYATEEGSVERMILSWMTATDQPTGNHFSDYITLPEK